MNIKDKNRKRINHTKRRESNEEVRARFEKEAHDRERLELDELRTNYEKWINTNHIYQMMR